MQEPSFQILAERVAQCEELAENARDPSIRAKAAELAQGYRKLILSTDRLRPKVFEKALPLRPPSFWPSERA
jgi:hypothetical protein